MSKNYHESTLQNESKQQMIKIIKHQFTLVFTKYC